MAPKTPPPPAAGPDAWPGPGGITPPDGGGTGSAQKSIWDLGELENYPSIIIDYGRSRRDLPKRLDQYDQQLAEKSLRPQDPRETWKLLRQPVNLFANDRDGYLRLQRGLFAAGFFGSKTWESVAGTAVDATMTAWRQVLIETARAQDTGAALTPEDILRKSIEGRKAGVGQGGQSLVRQHEDPKAVAGILQQAAQASLGRNLSTQEIEHFISQYRAAEDAYYAQAEKADVTPGIHNLTKPNLEAQADSFVQGGHGTEMAGEEIGAYGDAFLRMVEGA